MGSMLELQTLGMQGHVGCSARSGIAGACVRPFIQPEITGQTGASVTTATQSTAAMADPSGVRARTASNTSDALGSKAMMSEH